MKTKIILSVSLLAILALIAWPIYSYYKLTQTVKNDTKEITAMIPLINVSYEVSSELVSTTTDQYGMTPFDEAVYNAAQVISQVQQVT